MGLQWIIITLLIKGIRSEDTECMETIDGAKYRGTVSHTRTGITCQRWDLQTPHQHTAYKKFSGPVSYHSNYCRNPDMSLLPWCFTADPKIRWQYCDIPVCHGVAKECLSSLQGREYRGTQTKTRNGFTCQRWDAISDASTELPLLPSSHSNYCRNLNNRHSPWCYTTNVSMEWDYCDIPYCSPSKECKGTYGGRDYRGTLSVTKDDILCQRWDSLVPHNHSYAQYFADPKSHHNFCRNFGDYKNPWCYTTNANMKWQYCDVPFCGLTEFSCTFDGGFCDLSVSNGSNFLWQMKDHPTGGSYIELELTPWALSAPVTLQILETPSFKPSSTARCLTINHYSKGAVLSVRLLHGETLQALSETHVWRTDAIIIPMSLTIYKIVISATFTSNTSLSNNKIRIDNIEITGQQCLECFQCLTGHLCIPSSGFCDMTPDCPDQSDEINCGVECSFDDAYYGYRNTTENGLLCQKLEGKNVCSFNNKMKPWCITETGKDWDYCSVPPCETGELTCEFEKDLCNWKMLKNTSTWIHEFSTITGSMVLALESSITLDNVGNRSMEAILYSKIQPASKEEGCLTFTYLIDGDGAQFSVYISSDTVLDDSERVFDRQDIDTGGIKEGSISTPVNTPFMVFFKGILTKNKRRIFVSMATYSSGICKANPFCDKGQYQCNDGSCIDVHNFCDFNYDCTDKSDENYCYIDCYSSETYTYKGTTNTTVSGITCQRWDEQSPHSHNFTNMESEENYCRSPDGLSQPWCFTMRSDIRNQSCGIPPCSSYGDCNPVWDIRGITYRGNRTKTRSGYTCQRWDKHSAHKHSLLDLEHNYCRNPENSSAAWCYTTDKETKYDDCNIPICRLQHCRLGSASSSTTDLNNCTFIKPRQADITNATLDTFQCINSTKTILKEEVCDGLLQCPRYDDEFPCTYDCPPTCTCRGLIYKCQSPSNIPQNARVIDISMNSVDMKDFTTYPYLVHLNLSGCSLSNLFPDPFFGVQLRAVNLQILDLSYNNIPVISKTLFNRLGNLLNLNISGNSIKILSLSSFTNIINLQELVIRNSNIDLINSDNFIKNFALRQVDLSYNRIRMVKSNAFHSFISLTKIDLSRSKITNIDYLFTQKMKYLYELDLSFNEIQSITYFTFSKLGMLKVLNIRYNNLKRLVSYAFSSCLSLVKLDIGNNQIKYIENKAFIRLGALTHLNLTNNSLTTLPASSFVYLVSLVTLDLSKNKIIIVEDNAFKRLAELEYLYINQNSLSVRKRMFNGMCKLQWLWTDSYTICCARPVSVDISKCKAPYDKISSCEQLIDLGILGVLLWFMAVFAVVGNIYVLYYILRNKQVNISQDCFIINLSISDLMMGIYLWIIALADKQYRNAYGYYDAEWRHSYVCTAAGVVATVSSQASVLFVLLITLDSCYALKSPFSKIFTRKVAKIVSVLAWIFSVFLSMIPLLLYQGFYTRSTVCISLPLMKENWNGWEYSAFIYVGLNVGLFLVILFGQIFILKEVRLIGKKNNNETRNRELAIFKSLSYIVLTDALCRVLVGIVGTFALSGVEIPSDVYAWMTVFVLPVNSALNPYIYTCGAIIKKNKVTTVSF